MWSILHYYLHPKMHDWGIVIWQVVNVRLEFLKISQSICWESGNTSQLILRTFFQCCFICNINHLFYSYKTDIFQTFFNLLFRHFIPQCQPSLSLLWIYLSKCLATWRWHICPGHSGTAHARSPGHAWIRGKLFQLGGNRGSGETQSVFHRERQGRTNTWIIDD